MPIEVGIWKIEDKPKKISFSAMESEAKLENLLCEDISLLSPDLMLLGRQIPTAYGTFIDMLAMDVDGNLSVIELKRHKTPRAVVAQAIDYSSWVQTLSYNEITEIYAERNGGKVFEKGFAEARNGPQFSDSRLSVFCLSDYAASGNMISPKYA
ncbi:MAG: endonuclease NucS [Candidatus Sedimenticola sp. (ex Thyasira tokunagai)]